MIFIVEDGSLIWRGWEIRLTPNQAKALELLTANHGHFMNKRDLAEHIWPATAPEWSDQCIYPLMRSLASKVVTEVSRIENARGFGYRSAGAIEVIHVQKVRLP